MTQDQFDFVLHFLSLFVFIGLPIMVLVIALAKYFADRSRQW